MPAVIPEAPTRTGQQRILDSALRIFAARGFGVGLRAVADDAGTSAALVLHHFGSKQGLRDAVDATVLDHFRQAMADTVSAMGTSAAAVGFTELGSDPVLRNYLRQLITADGANAETLLTEVLALTHEQLSLRAASGGIRPGADLWWSALQIVGLIMTPVMFGPLLEKFHHRLYDDAGIAARTRENLALLERGLFESR